MSGFLGPYQTIPTHLETKVIELKNGKPVFLTGRNGTGKSALVHNLLMQLEGVTIYLPGSRTNSFQSDSLNMTPASKQSFTTNIKSWNSDPSVRFRPVANMERSEKAILDLQMAEVQFKLDAADDIRKYGTNSKAIDLLQLNDSPLDRTNRLLAQGNIPVRVTIEKGELVADRDATIYSIARMSDGERSALIMTAEVIAAEAGSIFLIDEPELHLHRAIVAPLLAALIRERPDCAFIVSTHELSLPSDFEESTIILTRGATWDREKVSAWDIDIIDSIKGIPESLRTDIIGSRRKILFIEGTRNSLDQPLYAILFPKVSIRPRESCREVQRAVIGLRSTHDLHHTLAFGLVDNDSNSLEEIQKLEDNGVYALPVYSVESLYYSLEVITALAKQQAQTLGLDFNELVKAAVKKSISSVNPAHMAARNSERRLRDTILSIIPSREKIVKSGTLPIQITVETTYPQQLATITHLIESYDFEPIVACYPVRESNMLHIIANELHFKNISDYESAALVRISTDSSLQDKLYKKLGKLSDQLK